MTTTACPHPPGVRRLALLGLILLLPASGARAALQDIALAGPCPNPVFEIVTVVGVPVAGQDIGLLPTAGNFFWGYDPAPPDPPCTLAAGVYNCNGITVAIPPNSDVTSVPGTAKVMIGGTPTAAATPFNFKLQVNEDGGSGQACSREYHVLVKTPFDISFVLDRSGSMSSAANVTPPAANRWDALKNGVNGFTPMLETTAPPGSNFGLTLFASGLLPNASFPAGLVPITSGPGGLANAVNAELSAQAPSGSTAMGAGLADAKADLANPARPRVVVLFTDGEQNVPPNVACPSAACPGAVCNIGGAAFNPTCPGAAGSLKVVTVAIGNPDVLYLTTLQRLAAQNRGTSLITANGSSFGGGCAGNPTAAFNCAIQPALSGNSPQAVASASGVLTGTVTLPFEVNRFVDQLLIQVSLSRKLELPGLAGLLGGLRISKDGSDVTGLFKTTLVGNFTNSVLLHTNFETGTTAGKIAPEGSYEIEWKAPTTTAGFEYQLTAYADDHRLGLEWAPDPREPRVDERFRPTVRLNWLSRPVEDATVEAIILKPGDDLGDLLARHQLKVRPADGADAGSPGYQKYLELLKDPDFLKSLLPKEQKLELEHRGGGLYSADYDPGNVSGVYQVLYQIRAKDAAFGELQRQAAESVYVRFGKIDLAASEPSATVAGSQVVLHLRPITRGGRFLGPANGAAIKVRGSGISVRRILDLQDGGYDLTLEGNPAAEIALDILGDEIYRGPAGKFGPGPHAGGGDTEGGGTGGTAHPCSKWPRWLRWLCHAVKG